MAILELAALQQATRDRAQRKRHKPNCRTRELSLALTSGREELLTAQTAIMEAKDPRRYPEGWRQLTGVGFDSDIGTQGRVLNFKLETNWFGVCFIGLRVWVGGREAGRHSLP